MRQFFCIACLVFSGCASKQIPPTILHFPPLAAGKHLMFPYGRYRHHVNLHIFRAQNGKDASFSFDGVAETSESKIQLVILSSFATTLAKITEDRATGDVRLEIFDDGLRKYENKFGEYYATLRKILVLNKNEKIPPNVTFSQIKRGIPRHIQVANEHFELQIKVEPLDEKMD